MKITLDKIVLFCMSIALFDMVSFATAQKPKDIDELDRLIAKSRGSMAKASTVVQAATKAEEKTLTAVVAHIEEVEHEVEIAQEKVEIFSARMIENGLDTSTIPQVEEKVEYVTEIKEAYEAYLKEGGDYDIENFMLYIYKKSK